MSSQFMIPMFKCAIAVIAVLGATSALAQKAQAVQSVQEINAPGKSPYQQNLTFTSTTCTSANLCSVAFPAVPANKRLVVTYVSARFAACTSDGSPDLPSVAIGTALTNSLLMPVPTRAILPALTNGAYQVVSAPATYYFEPGEIPTVFLSTAGGAVVCGLEAKVSVVGYFVSLP